MATCTTIANKMAKDFVYSQNKNYALNKIIYDLNHLVYSDTQELLHFKDKFAVMKNIFRLIAGQQEFMNYGKENISADITDILLFYEKSDFIRVQLNSNIAKHAQVN